MCDVTNRAWVKDSLKVQNRPMDFNVTEYKKTDRVSAATLQTTFKKLLFVDLFVISKQNTLNDLKRLLPIPITPHTCGFLFLFQMKQRITTD